MEHLIEEQYKTLEDVQQNYLQNVVKTKGRISKQVEESFIHATGYLLKAQALDLQTEIRHLNLAEQFRIVAPKIGASPSIQIEVFNFRIQITGELAQYRHRLASLGFVGIILGDRFGYISEEVDEERQHMIQVQKLRITYGLI